MFTTNIDLWCFSFVTLFNLQGTRPSASAAEHVLSYHVVQLLSSTFFNFFEVFSVPSAAFRRSLRQLIYFTRASWVCQALFSLRSKFFRPRHQRFRRVSDSLLTLPDHSQFVKYFFQKFPLAIYYIFDRENALSCSPFTSYLGFPFHSSKFTSILQAPFPRYSSFTNRSSR